MRSESKTLCRIFSGPFDAKRLPARIASTRCADLFLAESRELRDALIAESEGLLELCRYDIAEYRTWLSA
jgi:hypothetical protein